jgi:hypothetical protein
MSNIKAMIHSPFVRVRSVGNNALKAHGESDYNRRNLPGTRSGGVYHTQGISSCKLTPAHYTNGKQLASVTVTR